jgi:hypothetical protein
MSSFVHSHSFVFVIFRFDLSSALVDDSKHLAPPIRAGQFARRLHTVVYIHVHTYVLLLLFIAVLGLVPHCFVLFLFLICWLWGVCSYFPQNISHLVLCCCVLTYTSRTKCRLRPRCILSLSSLHMRSHTLRYDGSIGNNHHHARCRSAYIRGTSGFLVLSGSMYTSPGVRTRRQQATRQVASARRAAGRIGSSRRGATPPQPSFSSTSSSPGSPALDTTSLNDIKALLASHRSSNDPADKNLLRVLQLSKALTDFPTLQITDNDISRHEWRRYHRRVTAFMGSHDYLAYRTV